jgi:hypothetical protein
MFFIWINASYGPFKTVFKKSDVEQIYSVHKSNMKLQQKDQQV